MRESSYYGAIGKYYLKHATTNVAWEAKITKTNRLPFKCLMAHQEEKLLEAERALAEKIDDVGRRKKPFDGFVLVKAESYVIAIYYKPRETQVFQIPIRNFLHQKYTSGEKSLSLEMARAIGTKITL